MSDDRFNGGATVADLFAETMARVEECAETVMWLGNRDERGESLHDWLKRWRRYPAAQRAAAAQEMRDYALSASMRLLGASCAANCDVTKARAEAMPNRERRLDASASALADLAALLDALAVDADADDVLDTKEPRS